jgi:phosphoribosylformylglycinamidine synthase
MLIGLGGGAASSMATGRARRPGLRLGAARQPEMERRCQEVIDRCWQLGDANPILFIHDVGAGGLSNALPELVNDGGAAALRAARGAQRRAGHVAAGDLVQRGPGALRAGGRAAEALSASRRSAARALPVRGGRRGHRGAAPAACTTSHFGNTPVDMPLDVLLGKPPRMHRAVKRSRADSRWICTASTCEEAAERVLRLPGRGQTRAFLITIGDRTITGLVARDQMVGPWQVPVADVR